MTSLSVSDLAGRHIRETRQERGWTVREVADKCADAGAPHITSTVLTNLETRRRNTREITMDEVLVLARVLEVPPLQLVVPHADETLQVVPGVELDAVDAADWIADDPIPSSEPPGVIRGPSQADSRPVVTWEKRLSRLVGQEVHRRRNQQKLTAQQVADRTAEVGMPISRSAVAALETGRRDTVAVAEVLVLAAALGVAPSELICPAGYDPQVEMLPGREMDPLHALRWIDGDLAIDISRQGVTVFRQPNAGEESGPRLLETHNGIIEQVQVNDSHVTQMAADVEAAQRAVAAGQPPDRSVEDARAELTFRVEAAARYREVAAQSLRYVRAEMTRRGMTLPSLPESLDPGPLPKGDAS